MKNLQWIRVSKSSPCPICQKPDWCNVLEDGSKAHCMRVQNNNPSHGKAGGWIYVIRDDMPRVKYVKPVKKETVKIDAWTLFQAWQRKTRDEEIVKLANDLQVEPVALKMIGCAWAPEHGAWVFPMKDGSGKIIGLRTRFPNGDKRAITGSRAGLFYPDHVSYMGLVYIVEGPSDTAAAICLGLPVIGRPSCQGSHDLVKDFIRNRKIQRVVIISDNDEAGIAGSEKLQEDLSVKSLMIVLDAKDTREFLKTGGTKQMIEDLTKNKVWVNPHKNMITG